MEERPRRGQQGQGPINHLTLHTGRFPGEIRNFMCFHNLAFAGCTAVESTHTNQMFAFPYQWTGAVQYSLRHSINDFLLCYEVRYEIRGLV